MMGAVLDHLWQSTLLALAVGLLILVCRRSAAAVRHGLWFAASAKFLVPFAALEALGRLLAPAGDPSVAAPPEVAFIAEATQPFSQPYAAAPAGHAALQLDPTLILVAVWALGFAAVLLVWMVSWAKVRSAMRSAIPLALSAPMPVLASSSLLEPGLVGLWRPALLVPASLFDRLDRSEIDAIVAHEACHLRRRDNLTAAVHMLTQALFWFHPMVWWIGARLIDERERACDEAVVRSGHDRAAYARGLVECCRLYLQSPLPCVAGASGSDLKARVKRIMTAPRSSPLSASAKAILLAAGVCALASPVAAGLLTPPTGPQAAGRVAAAASSSAPVRMENARPAGPASSARSAHAPSGPVMAMTSTDAKAAAGADPAPPASVEDAGRPQLAQLQLGRPGEEVVSPAVVQTALQQAPAMALAEAEIPPAGLADDPDQTICRTQAVTGSRFQKRVCLTRMEWSELQRRVAVFERRLDDSEIGAFFY